MLKITVGGTKDAMDIFKKNFYAKHPECDADKIDCNKDILGFILCELQKYSKETEKYQYWLGLYNEYYTLLGRILYNSRYVGTVSRTVHSIASIK